MKKKVIISISILITIIVFVIGIIFYNKPNIIAHVDIHIPSLIESSTTYTYYIYKKNNGKYTYKKVEVEKWIRETTSKKTVDSGKIKNKEDLEMIQKDIDESNKINYFYPGHSNAGIYYQDERLNTLEELSEKLF